MNIHGYKTPKVEAMKIGKWLGKEPRKEKNWTRQEYETAYRGFRRLDPAIVTYRMWGIANEVVNAADYSYQAYGYEMSGWTSTARRKRFHAILIRVYTTRGEIPF